MNRQEKIRFRFKGERQYVHGTDMYNSMLAQIPETSEVEGIRFTINHLVSNLNCVCIISDSKAEHLAIENTLSRMQLSLKGDACWIALVEDSAIATDADRTEERYEYDEDLIESRVIPVQDSISLVSTSPYSFIETVVSMNKKLHKSLFPDALGTWQFTRLDMPQLVTDVSELRLQLKHNMNFKLTKTDILLSDNKIGDLYFSLVPT